MPVEALKPSKRTTAQPEDHSEETSETEETKRIRDAKRQWEEAPKASKKCQDEGASSSTSSPFEEPPDSGDTGPASLISFARKIVASILTEEESQRIQSLHEKTITLGEFCAGMGAGTIVAAVLEKVFCDANAWCPTLQTAFFTECQKWKQQVCGSVHKHLHSDLPVHLFDRTADLAQSQPPKLCDIGIVAIECDDVSSCTSTPRSVLDRQGKSGSSFLEFCDYLKAIDFNQRPKFLMIECVAGLQKKRKLQAAYEKGTEIVTQELFNLGFTGQFKTLNTKHFSLPQSRTRTYGVFLE